MTCRRSFVAALGLCALTASTSASASAEEAAKPVAAPGPGAIDISEARPQMIVLSDGKSHFLALTPPGAPAEAFFYGDGKRFHKLVSSSSSRNGEAWERSFIEPRLTDGGHEEGMAFVNQKGGVYTVMCGTRTTVLKPVPAAEQQAILTSASFEKSLRKYRPYALGRDERGVYYYVDRGYQPEEKNKFRLFAGPKGNLKQQKMLNVVSDSEGDIFATKTGTLRLILGKKETLWVEGKKRSPLTMVPLDFNRNVAMVYTELGVYAGERLGTPCDDL